MDAIIDGEDCRVGIESTVVDMTGDVPTILRPGIITAESIQAALGREVVYDGALLEKGPIEGSDDFKPRSPGL